MDAGRLYGTTIDGGAHGTANSGGIVFELAPNVTRTRWVETVLYSFCTKANCTDGEQPYFGGLIMDAGHLYGTTANGGAQHSGTAFELIPNAARTDWTETVLYSFCTKANCTDGQYPYAGLIMDAAGHLYGTTSLGGAHGNSTAFSGGTVFELP
jgi:hypothetical protein